MGNKFEVHSWLKEPLFDDYKYVMVYRGESLIAALAVMWKEKRRGVGCVKFYWR
jgi:hypothetical protein